MVVAMRLMFVMRARASARETIAAIDEDEKSILKGKE